MENTREIVLDTLLAIESGQGYSHKVIKDVLDKYNYLDGQEKAFIKRVTEGTLERQIEIDYVLDSIASVPVKKMKPLIRSLLRMGIYQIFYMDGVPDSAACNEAVKLAAKRKFHNLKGFVNGILRKAALQKADISFPDREKEPVRYLSVKYSMPAWLVEIWLAEYGQDVTETMLQALLLVRPVTIRFVSSLSEQNREALLAQMEARNVKAVRHPYLPYAYCLTGTEGIQSLPGYEEGCFAVQDVSSMLAVEAAGIGEGDLVLDICAAPGGKTMLAAEKAGKTGRVEARDVSEYKTELMQDNLRRMKLTNVTVKIWDATQQEEAMRNQADVVLADVPCSGLGVIGRKRDIKYNVTPASLESIIELQKNIIQNAVSYVKEGGILLYSTCTIRREENEAMVQWICDKYPFILEETDSFLPEALHSTETARGYIQLMPGFHEADGFFLARLRKRTDDGKH